MWNPSVWVDDDGNQILVNVEDSRITHVATRPLNGRTWGPPLACIVPSTLDIVEPAPVRMCSDCGRDPILTTDGRDLCAACLVKGLRL